MFHLLEALPLIVNLIDEEAHMGKGANTVLSMLYKFFKVHGLVSQDFSP